MLGGYRFDTIGFLSDYGLADEFVGVCHGVMLRMAPHLRIIDITHGVAPHDVAGGALLLSEAVAYLPVSVHLAVVDPGVGSPRHGVVLATADGSLLVGPDNGLLSEAADRLGGVCSSYRLPAARTGRTETGGGDGSPDVPATFHGRDVFAPTAARLALGAAPEQLGEAMDPGDLVRLSRLPAGVGDGACRGTVVHVDRFGNLQTNIGPAEVEALGLQVGSLMSVEVAGRRWTAPYAGTFASVPPGCPVLVMDSHAALTLCLNQASASGALAVQAGARVVIRPSGRQPQGPACSSGGGSPGSPA